MARGRPSRAAARRSTPVRSATPQQGSDEDMVDAPESRPESSKEEEEEDAESAAQASDEEQAPSERSPSPVVTCALALWRKAAKWVAENKTRPASRFLRTRFDVCM